MIEKDRDTEGNKDKEWERERDITWERKVRGEKESYHKERK